MALYGAVIQVLAALAVLCVGVSAVVFGLLLAPSGRERLRAYFGGSEWQLVGWAWLVALVATAGSLYLSEIMHFVPCLLCWYQRIAMYPLVVVLGVATFRRDIGVWRVAMPLPAIGLLISAYHVLLQYQPTLEVVSCNVGAPCSGRYMAVFGFVSIPVLAGAAFLMILALLAVAALFTGPGSEGRFLAVGD